MQYSLGAFEIDDELFELRQGERRIPIAPRAFDTLLFLFINKHRVVTKAELRARVWSGSVVTDDALNQAIRKVRRIVGGVAAIQSVRGRGYRLVFSDSLPVSESSFVAPLRSSEVRPAFAVLSE